jgi:hypothetical protein
MARHRFLDLVDREPGFQPSPSAASASGFVMCPPALQAAVLSTQWQAQQLLYRWAFEQARAVVRPSILERYRAFLEN